MCVSPRVCPCIAVRPCILAVRLLQRGSPRASSVLSSASLPSSLCWHQILRQRTFVPHPLMVDSKPAPCKPWMQDASSKLPNLVISTRSDPLLDLVHLSSSTIDFSTPGPERTSMAAFSLRMIRGHRLHSPRRCAPFGMGTCVRPSIPGTRFVGFSVDGRTP